MQIYSSFGQVLKTEVSGSTEALPFCFPTNNIKVLNGYSSRSVAVIGRLLLRTQNSDRLEHLDAMIMKISDHNISAGRRHSTEVWTGKVPRITWTTRSKLVNYSSVWLENIHSTAAIVHDNNATVGIAADTLRTKQLACTNAEQQ